MNIVEQELLKEVLKDPQNEREEVLIQKIKSQYADLHKLTYQLKAFAISFENANSELGEMLRVIENDRD